MDAPRKVVAMSGGKDSTCLALALQEHEPGAYEYVGNFTGNELPALAEHLVNLERLLGTSIRRIGAGIDLYQLIDQMKMIPNFRARFCTRVLKIEPMIAYMSTLPAGSILYVGLRADEAMRVGIYGEEFPIRFPLREWGWGVNEVMGYLDKRGVQIPARTDCGMCFYQRLGEWWELWKSHPEEFARGVEVENRIGHTFRSARRDTWPASLAELAKEFERGHIPRGAELQLNLFGGTEKCRVCSL